MKTREMIKTLIFFKTALFKQILKNNTFTFYAWSFLLVHIILTPSKRPKNFVNCFLFFHSKSDQGKKPFPWSNYMVHGVNRP